LVNDFDDKQQEPLALCSNVLNIEFAVHITKIQSV